MNSAGIVKKIECFVPGVFVSDGIHPVREGIRALAGLVQETQTVVHVRKPFDDL